jgi:predicted nucleotidyltransferase
MAKTAVIKIVKKFVDVLKSEGITVHRAFLFGSYLSNSNNKESDIDIMIVTDNEDDYLFGKVWSLTKRVNIKIEPILVAKTRFNETDNSPLVDFVKSNGLEIV